MTCHETSGHRAGNPGIRTVLNEPGPVDVCLHVLSFSPATARVFLAVSRALKKSVEDHLDANAEEIFNLLKRSDVHPLVDQRIRHCYFRSMEQRCHSSGYNLFCFHASVRTEMLALGLPLEGNPDSIPAPGEISGFNKTHVQAAWDLNLQKIWGSVRREIAKLNPLPEDLPANDAPAQVVRAWMQTHPMVLQGITELNLGCLDLTSVPIEISLFTGLRVLDLWHNQLRALSEGIFQGLERLEMLSLKENQLTSLPEEVFQCLRQLQVLFLQENQLTSLPERVFRGLGRLDRLFLTHNQLTFLPEGVFQGLGQLDWLSLGDNLLTSLPEEIFQELKQLDTLSLQHNRLTTLPGGLLRVQSQLVDLDLDNNQLRSLPEGLFAQAKHRLRFLYLRNNQLLSIPERLFEGLDRLQGLYMYNNKGLLITWDDPGCINNIDLKAQMHEFFGYRCKSPLAEFYQLVAGDVPSEVVRSRFENLDETIRNAIGEEEHAFDDMQRFKTALKRYIKTRWEAEGTVCYDINILARIDAMCHGRGTKRKQL